MVTAEQLNAELVRLRVALAAMVLALLFLGGKLWHIQVLHVTAYRTSLDQQSIRRVRLPGSRGRIFDRNGVCLADNQPSYCVAIYVEELRQPGRWASTIDEVERVVEGLAGTLGLSEQDVDREDIRRHIYRRLPLPFLAWRGVDQEVLARWAESTNHYPGVDIYVEPVRAYPQGGMAAHVLGYVGRADRDWSEEEGRYHFYLPEVEGKYGLEKAFNERLTGLAGGRLLRVDASGFKHGDEGGVDPIPGDDLRLTLDSRIQALAERSIAGERGALVMLDPRNGDVLAIASAPSFSPSDFSPYLSAATWARISSDKGRPLFNRAVSGTYAPGSTFKPLVAVAALENHQADAGTEFDCPGYFALGTVRFRCWNPRGHGVIAMRKSIEQSCNAYFCQLGLQAGYERMYHMAEALGFGSETGIELPYESSGLLPDDTWKRRVYNDGWRAGDTCNVSIGQGALAATPLQMAMFTSALANGGTVYRPRLIGPARSEGEVVNDMGWAPATLSVVQGGMRDVVQAESGTGKRARVDGVEMAGKTGTAEYGPRSNRKKYAWMTLFAPADNPRYALAIVLEDAVSGGTDAAPRVRALMTAVFRLEQGASIETLLAGEDEA